MTPELNSKDEYKLTMDKRVKVEGEEQGEWAGQREVPYG